MHSTTWRRRGGAAFAATTALLAVSAAPAFADVSGEFESGVISPTSNAKAASETAAGGGAAVEMWDPSSVALSVTNGTDATSAYKIRARQEICGPAAAQMVVKVDGVTAGTFTVSATTYTDYTVTGNWAAGAHTITVSFPNAYHNSNCIARELWVDRVTAVSAATGPAYYVDRTAAAGGDGTSAATAWDSISDVNAANLPSGATVLFKTGQTFTGAALVADNAGVTYGSYGGGARPILDGGGTSYPITISAPFVTVKDVHVRNAGQADKIGLVVNAPDAKVQNVTATGNAIGIQAMAGAHRLRVTGSTVTDNTTVIAPGGTNDDYGASGIVVLAADDVEIDHNTISRNVGPSPDFVFDGSAVEIFGGIGTSIHHNVAVDNQTFSELGDNRTANTRFSNNLVTTSASFSAGQVLGINVQGSEGVFGVVKNTVITNNTFVLRNPDAGVLVVGLGADATFHNNIVEADQSGYTYQPIDEGHNVYYGEYYNGVTSTANTSAEGGIAPSSATADPLFVSATDFHLQTGSPAKNRGVSAYGVTTDLDGLPRLYGSGVDAGAYERQSN
ncbi:carbohydrate-binding domain-containing protein [Actinoplanes sp. CA-131856]